MIRVCLLGGWFRTPLLLASRFTNRYMYIYIYIERERERYIYTHMYAYISIYLSLYIYIHIYVYIYIEREMLFGSGGVCWLACAVFLLY